MVMQHLSPFESHPGDPYALHLGVTKATRGCRRQGEEASTRFGGNGERRDSGVKTGACDSRAETFRSTPAAGMLALKGLSPSRHKLFTKFLCATAP